MPDPHPLDSRLTVEAADYAQERGLDRLRVAVRCWLGVAVYWTASPSGPGERLVIDGLTADQLRTVLARLAGEETETSD